MRNQHTSMDGFMPRRGPLADSGPASGLGRPQPETRSNIGQTNGTSITSDDSARRQFDTGIRRSDIDDSLAKIQDEETPKKQKRGLFRRKSKKVLTKKQRIIRRVLRIIALLIVLVIGFVVIRAIIASGNVLQGNVFDILQSKPLRMDANGRSNIVVFGTSEDDPGHEGALLTDSIMLVSVDQNRHNAFLLSIPRDLWVDYGRACNSGMAGRINEVYSCNSGDGDDEEAGATALQKKVGEITGLETHYYTHMNYSVLRDSVDAVGGVSVVIDSDDPRGIFDDNFDWMCNRKCNYVKYPNGPTGNMDGKHALALARARGASGNTYGLAGANFDREKYQRKILIALKEKASSAGTLTNVGKVTGLIDAMGNNLRTNFQTSEVRTLMDIGTKTPSDDIKSLLLNDEETPLVTGSTINGASVLIPSAGQGNFSDIQAYVRKSMSRDPVAREGANVVVMNGTTSAGVAMTESGRLTEAGYTVTETANAPSTDYERTVIYRINKKENSGTAKALAKRYGVKIAQSDPDFVVADGVDFVVIIGEASLDTSDQQ